jgi:hypothetical protein
MRIVPALCVCLATVPANGLFGQVPRLEFGTRVRVTAPSIEGSPFIGVFISADESSLILDVADDRTPAWSVWLDAVESLEVSLGSRANTWKGMGLGALGGGLLGAGFMGIVCAVEGGCDADGATTAGWMAFGWIVGTGVGAALGTIIGAAIRTETWQPVELN